jgi:hypothetical protein
MLPGIFHGEAGGIDFEDDAFAGRKSNRRSGAQKPDKQDRLTLGEMISILLFPY